MKLKTVSKEELETMSYDDVAYVILKEAGKKMSLTDLFDKVCELNASGYYTVNSSPYARGVYEHLGFEYTASEQSVNGLKFYPMKNDKILEYIQTKRI